MRVRESMQEKKIVRERRREEGGIGWKRVGEGE